MKIVKQNDKYLVADMRNTNYEGNFQILEATKEN
jgi:hypothetical protein